MPKAGARTATLVREEFCNALDFLQRMWYDCITNKCRFNGGVTMANGLLQLRIDENLRKEASDVYSQLGLDLPTAIRMFLTRSVQVRGIPFSMILPEENYKATAAVVAMKRMSSDAENAGVAEMTLDEINAEIEAVRNGK